MVNLVSFEQVQHFVKLSRWGAVCIKIFTRGDLIWEDTQLVIKLKKPQGFGFEYGNDRFHGKVGDVTL